MFVKFYKFFLRIVHVFKTPSFAELAQYFELNTCIAVSYTHLDVYKRQVLKGANFKITYC